MYVYVKLITNKVVDDSWIKLHLTHFNNEIQEQFKK